MADLAAIRARHTALAGHADRQLHDDVAVLLAEIDRFTDRPDPAPAGEPVVVRGTWDPGPRPSKYGPQ